MYGASVLMLPREADTLPGAQSLPDRADGVKALLADRAVNFRRGLAGRVFDFAERWMELTQAFPKVRKYVHLTAPDLQGPFPLAELMWGSEVYLAFYDDEDTIIEALDFFAWVIAAFLEKYLALIPPFDSGHSVEWGLLHKGHIIIRDDAAMNISGEMYREFVKPRDSALIGMFGGGIHFCGRGDHYIAHIADIEGLSTFNMSQPECNDMEVIYRNTADRGIVIIGLPEWEVRRAVSSGRDLSGRVHCGASIAAWADMKVPR
jgi:hypothetical protein